MVTGTLRYSRPVDEVGSLATVTVQAGTAATGYETTYLTDFSDVNLGHPTKATGTSIALQLDFGAAQTLAAMLIWHNFDDASTVTIQANSAAAWGAPPFTTSVVVPTQRGDGRKVKVWALLNQTYRYWLITTPTNSVPPGLKVQCYNTIRSLTGFSANPNAGQTFLWGVHRQNAQWGINLSTDFGFHWVYDFGVGQETLSGDVAVSDSDLIALKTWQESNGGRRVSLFVPDSNAAEAWLARLALGPLGPMPHTLRTDLYTSLLDPQIVSPDYNLVTIIAEDVTAGGPEWT